MLKFFLDTASIDEINYWNKFGLVDGVTTNPSLLAKEDSDPIKILREISKITKGDVSAQVTETSEEDIIEQALYLKDKVKKNNIVIKIPCTKDGILASKKLVKNKIKLNITLGFDPAQILFFRNINITYFSFIIGKIEDYNKSNIENIAKLSLMIKTMNLKAKLLSASIRNSSHLINAIKGGSDIITVPPSTWSKILENEYSAEGLKDFLNNWKKLSKIERQKYEIKK